MSDHPSRGETAKAAASKAGSTDRTRQSKRDQLRVLLTKRGGARASVLCSTFGWQPHTVRAAISGLRKSGCEVVVDRSDKHAETVYRIEKQPRSGEPEQAATSTGEGAASVAA